MTATQASDHPRWSGASATRTPVVVTTRTAKKTSHPTSWRPHISSSSPDDVPGSGLQSEGWSALIAPSCRAALGPAEGPGTHEESRQEPHPEDQGRPAVLPHAGHLLRLPVVGEEDRAHPLG